MRQRLKLHIKGIVQGVGFRPYIYNLSKKFSLGGFVFNDSRGVVVEVEGDNLKIRKFINELKSNPPAISSIDAIEERRLFAKGERNFFIKESISTEDKFTRISYDLSVCSDCLKELFTKNDRRYLYPFINCINCGPRFTITKDIPYDRANTTMKDFTMCPNCVSEYKDRFRRRFHAEPNACFACGPGIEFSSEFKNSKHKSTTFKDTQAILKQTAELIYKGSIVAIKGVGGYHLGCDAKNIEVVMKLRRRKNRPTKPFALMVDSLEAIKELCFMSPKEEELIMSPRRPIVLLKVKKRLTWTEAIAPQQRYLGIMLAYTPLHYLIFHYLRKYDKSPILVMTSANKKDFPLISEEKELAGLRGYVDYFLMHNRTIYMRCDDSISRVFRNKEIIIRKARGYTSDFAQFTHKKNILGCGAELKNTFSIAKDNHLITSSYIGDLKSYRNYEFFLNTLAHYRKVFNVEPEAVAYDYHPNYLSTQYALSLKDKQKIAVQHHHAHLAACLFENNIQGKVIGVCFDGVGLGLDNNIWGGEFFIADKKDFQRAGHFKYFGLIGQDKATEEPGRVAFCLLHSILGENLFNLDMEFIRFFSKKELDIFLRLISNKEFTLSSSAGRLFDAAASILSIKNKITYEAEAAILLEMLATDYKGKIINYEFAIDKENNSYIVDWQPVFLGLLNDIKKGKSHPFIAYKFHYTFANIIKEMSKILRRNCGIDKVVLSGGVFQNALLLRLAVKLLEKANFSVYYHHRFPFNDGAISIGQVVVANENI
ncbi:MAG: carbamoyltransferase HypF [Candidatus Omnitrophota bacterium]|nr:carbamoyltransferase HypF [Candidatus Omnitrophota bacterium]